MGFNIPSIDYCHKGRENDYWFQVQVVIGYFLILQAFIVVLLDLLLTRRNSMEISLKLLLIFLTIPAIVILATILWGWEGLSIVPV